jgi:carboxypeptidase family protein
MHALKAEILAAGEVVVAGAACLCIMLMSTAAGLYAAESPGVRPAGGRILGVIQVEGGLPQLEPPKITKDKDVCKDVPNESLLVGAERGLQNAVVTLEGTPKEAASAVKPAYAVFRLNNQGCRFVPHVIVMQSHDELEIGNADPILHTARALPAQVDVGLYPGRAVRKEIGAPPAGPVRITCEIHPWMGAYVFLTDNPYYAVTDVHGEYEIDNVPPGKYRVKIWHELLGTQIGTVVVTAGKSTELNFKFDSGKTESR